MKRVFRQIRFLGILTGTFIILHSCILKEFNFNENKLDTDWDMHMMSPLFYGDMEFKDFVYDWKSPIVANSFEPTIQLKYAADSSIIFPTKLIFEPATIIDDFNFLIEGDDFLSQAALKYIVTNGSPYPLNLQMRFFEKQSSAAQSPAILPPAFPAAKIENGGITPVKTEYTLPLTADQLESFKMGNRVEFVSWFEEVPGFNPDTLSAHYPIQLSIVLSGIAHGYYQ
jgi:hypothetical protein